MSAVATEILTAKEFARLPDDGIPSELVRGRIVRMNIPKPLHGLVCGNITVVLGSFVKKHQLGWVFSNDSGVITERNPDSVRGPDVAYCSYKRLPKRSRPKRDYLDVAPELAFEVRSPDDRWSKLQAKVAEDSVIVVQTERGSPLDDAELLRDWERRHYGRNELLIWQREIQESSTKDTKEHEREDEPSRSVETEE